MSGILHLITVLSIFLIFFMIHSGQSSNWRKNLPNILKRDRQQLPDTNLDNVQISESKEDKLKADRSKARVLREKSKSFKNYFSNELPIYRKSSKEKRFVGTSGKVIGKYDKRIKAVCTGVYLDLEIGHSEVEDQKHYICEIGYKNKKGVQLCQGIKAEVWAGNEIKAFEACEKRKENYFVYISTDEILIDCE